MSEQRSYGDAVAHSLGMTDAPILTTTRLAKTQLAVTRIVNGPERMGRTAQIPPEDSFILAVHMTGIRHHEIWRLGKRVLAQGYAPGSIRIFNLEHGSQAYVGGEQDTLSFYLPRAALDELAREDGRLPLGQLACPPGLVDPVIGHLAAALLPAFDRPDQASALFVDHVTLAVQAHVALRYGDGARTGLHRPLGINPARQHLAQEFLASRFADDVSLADAARASGLSRGHFLRSFRAATGVTPHQWLQRYRVDRAKGMLQTTSMPIAEIAIACGFADQSHLTRVFTRFTGLPPAAWRRQVRM